MVKRFLALVWRVVTRVVVFVDAHLPKILVFGLVAAGVVVEIRVYPAPIQLPQDPDVLERIFASRTTIGAIRLAIFYAVAFLALSVFASIWNRRWLRRAGPFEISEEVVKDLRREVETLVTSAEADQAEIARLKEQIRMADEVVELLRDRLVETEKQAGGVSRRRRWLPWRR